MPLVTRILRGPNGPPQTRDANWIKSKLKITIRLGQYFSQWPQTGKSVRWMLTLGGTPMGRHFLILPKPVQWDFYFPLQMHAWIATPNTPRPSRCNSWYASLPGGNKTTLSSPGCLGPANIFSLSVAISQPLPKSHYVSSSALATRSPLVLGTQVGFCNSLSNLLASLKVPEILQIWVNQCFESQASGLIETS